MIHDVVVATVRTGVGDDGDTGRAGTLGEGVGQKGAGTGTGAENQDLELAPELLDPLLASLEVGGTGRSLGVARGSGNLFVRRGGQSGLATIGGLELGVDCGLLLAEAVVVGLAERVVNDEVDDQKNDGEHERERCEARGHDHADRARRGPRDGVHLTVHAQRGDEELEDHDVGDRRQDERDEEVGVEDQRRAEENGLVNGKERGDERRLADGLELLGAHEEHEDDGDQERAARTAHVADECEVVGEGVRSVLTGLEELQISLGVGEERGVERRAHHRGAVDAHEPEERDERLVDDQAGIAVCCREERGQQGAQGLGEGNVEEVAHHEVNQRADDHREREREDVAEALGDGAGDLLGQMDGDIALDAEGVHVHGDKSRDEG